MDLTERDAEQAGLSPGELYVLRQMEVIGTWESLQELGIRKSWVPTLRGLQSRGLVAYRRSNRAGVRGGEWAIKEDIYKLLARLGSQPCPTGR